MAAPHREGIEGESSGSLKIVDKHEILFVVLFFKIFVNRLTKTVNKKEEGSKRGKWSQV